MSLLGGISQEAQLRAIAASVDDLTRSVARLEGIALRMERFQQMRDYRAYSIAHGSKPLGMGEWIMSGQPES